MTVRVRHAAFGSSKKTIPPTGNYEWGKFVGESIDGPRGVIGVLESLGTTLNGVYGADIAP